MSCLQKLNPIVQNDYKVILGQSVQLKGTVILGIEPVDTLYLYPGTVRREIDKVAVPF